MASLTSIKSALRYRLPKVIFVAAKSESWFTFPHLQPAPQPDLQGSKALQLAYILALLASFTNIRRIR